LPWEGSTAVCKSPDERRSGEPYRSVGGEYRRKLFDWEAAALEKSRQKGRYNAERSIECCVK
jgi:hypothetical protein